MTPELFRTLIRFLGATVIICATGGFALAAVHTSAPDAVIALGAGALGALSTAFVRPPDAGVQKVEVVEQPVATTEVAPKKAKK